MKKYLAFLSLIVYSNFNYSQLNLSYDISSELFIDKKIIRIDQDIVISNNSSKSLDTLYLNDWSNSYSGLDSQLALKFAEKFNRSFYYSSNKKKGNTKINMIDSNNSFLRWKRLADQNDIIRLVLEKPIRVGEKFTLKLNYSVSIPDISFSGGYGIQKNKYVNIKDYIISVSRYENNKWFYQSNLNLNDNSINKSNYMIKWTYPKSFFLCGSLNHLNTVKRDSIKISNYKAIEEGSPHFIFSLNNNLNEYSISDDINIYSDIFDIYDENTFGKINRIYKFLINDFNFFKKEKSTLLITRHDYDLEPLYGLNIIPEILSPFDKRFINEIKFLKTFTAELIRKQLDINLRTQYWISDGLTIFFIMKYISSFYPEKKIIGRFSDNIFFKNYTFSEKEFNEIFMVYSELMIRNNRYQSSITTKDRLIKFNEKISNPYFLGQLFLYIEYYLQKDDFDYLLSNLSKVSSLDELKILIKNQSNNNKNILNLLKLVEQRDPIDLKIEKVHVDEKFITVASSQNSKNKIPYEISLVKNDTIVDSKWVNEQDSIVRTDFKLVNDIDYVIINANKALPESNKINNNYYLKSKVFAKPLSVKLIKDFENPNKTQLLVNPIISYNLYDGPSFGLRLHNKTLQRRPFNYFIEPTYSSYEKSLIGSFNFIYRKYKFSKANYLTQFNLFGSSFHYAPNSLYKIIVPSINLYFRPEELISNLRHNLSFSLYNIHRESRANNTIIPNYSIGQFEYVFSNKNLIDYLTINNSLEISNKFNKASFEIQYRKLFPSARLFSSRLFFGTFIGNYRNLNSYFFFNLNRPNDYLFEYYYLGRSETEGFYSQQYIMNEGGFKSSIPDSSSNKSIVAANFSMGIWKWVEVYSDLGLIKNIDESSKTFYDYGLKLNILPDYFEIFFPLASSYQNEINQTDYLSRIRFTLSLNSKQIFNLFSRTWF